jgi:RNA polymerase sigma factor (sigma-70 family)
MREDLLRFTHVCFDVNGPALRLAHQQCAAVGEHGRVVVHVHDARGRVGRLRDLVDVTHAGQSRADVEELGDPRFRREVADGAAEERPVLPRGRPHRRPGLQRLAGGVPVNSKRFRRQRVREELRAAVPERAADAGGGLADRAALREALSRLGPRQRAVILLRFWLDMSETSTAQALNCSAGTVKSQTSRALATLRRHTEITEGELR